MRELGIRQVTSGKARIKGNQGISVPNNTIQVEEKRRGDLRKNNFEKLNSLIKQTLTSF